jgi:hypothetical protein
MFSQSSICSYLVQRRKLSDPSEKLSDVQKTIVRLFQEKPATTTILTETAFGEILIDFSLGVKLALRYRQDPTCCQVADQIVRVEQILR